MKKLIALSSICLFLIQYQVQAQTTVNYAISFIEAVHHRAKIEIEYSNLRSLPLEMTMPRSSPGRYAIHEFAKNVFDVKAFDENGEALNISRPDPYTWLVSGHEGYVKFSYQLFANRADGTYSQVDETHAHLNMPATFMFSETYAQRPIRIDFKLPEGSNWKVATQLKKESDGKYYAPDLQYFMDSPTEISNHRLAEWTVGKEANQQTIKIAFHSLASDAVFEKYIAAAKEIVKQEIAVFGELPNFDFGSYTFLACYMPQSSGDGMEHRNSTVLTSSIDLNEDNINRVLSTVAHEFVHAWNVERIRPASLKPFDFTEANMSGELWFAEGFTSYYTGLIMARSGLTSEEDYVNSLSRGINYVKNHPGRRYFNPIEMSYKAPFVDAASSIDPTYWENIFISYYTYGSVLGLALDLSLRNSFDNKTLDGYMQLIWSRYGRTEIGYEVRNLQQTLADYTDSDFADDFFQKYIYESGFPDYKSLFKKLGVEVSSEEQTFLGARLSSRVEGLLLVSEPEEDSPLWNAGLYADDLIISIKDQSLATETEQNSVLDQLQNGDVVKIRFIRQGIEKSTELEVKTLSEWNLSIMEKMDRDVRKRKDNWLKSR